MSGLYRLLRQKWMPPVDPTTSFDGQTILITGANTGLGFEAAIKFASLGASKVIIGVRNIDSGIAAKHKIEQRVGRNGLVEVWSLDMNSYTSIQAFADRATNYPKRIDAALLNAGIRNKTFKCSSYGWEETLQVNVLSTALLGLLLLPKLKTSGSAVRRAVLQVTSSGTHVMHRIPADHETAPNILESFNVADGYNAARQYSLSKLFIQLAISQLALHVNDENGNPDVVVLGTCPGLICSGLARSYTGALFWVAYMIFTFLFARSTEEGARSLVSGVALGERGHGRFWQHDKLHPSARHLDEMEREELRGQVWYDIMDAWRKSVSDTTWHVHRLLNLHLHIPTNVAFKVAPLPPYRNRGHLHGKKSLFRYLFPNTHQRARESLWKFRSETLPSLRHRAQAQIYRYIVHRQSLNRRRRPSRILDLVRRVKQRKDLPGIGRNKDGVKMSRSESSTGSWREGVGNTDFSSLRSEGREPGTRRKKLAGYFKAANELRQSYQQSYTEGWRRDTQFQDVEDNSPGAFPDATVVRTGEEEMILFPSYATKHVKSKPDPDRRHAPATSGNLEDSGPGDEEFWRLEWQKYEDDHAVVDVDVRGWIYTPFKGMMSRKQRIFIGLARQLVGIPAPPSQEATPSASRSSSPLPYQDRLQARTSQQEEAYVAKEAEDIMRKGEAEVETASKGQYSESSRNGQASNTILGSRSRTTSPDSTMHARIHDLRHESSVSSMRSNGSKDMTPIQKRASWNQPANMTPQELRQANTHLMTRLKPFMASPMANTAISVFFYNEDISRQRTVTTNAAGHFSVRAALDFVPTHVRVLASEKLSATEKVNVTRPKGVSLISDVDDTLKHSAIGSGAREIFRNAFIRELDDLTIDGVRDWYGRLADMGVQFHYVSNSPWQLFPVVSKFFTLAGLPPGSFHLKQYSGMLQGIFEPVAERKKGTLDKIARDFPERKFLLVGDSGEADLEVYTDFVLENPGRVLAVFIRDVTTSSGSGFFNSSMGPLTGDRVGSARGQSGNSQMSAAARGQSDDDDPDYKAAIAASLRDMEIEEQRRSQIDRSEQKPKLPPRKPMESTSARRHGDQEKLIDISDDEVPLEPKGFDRPTPQRYPIDRSPGCNPSIEVASSMSPRSQAPIPPRKPVSLRSPGIDNDNSTAEGHSRTNEKKHPPPPPKPRRTSTLVSTTPSIEDSRAQQRAQLWNQSRPIAPPKPLSLSDQQQSYTSSAKQKIVSVYNNLPSASSYWYGAQDQGTRDNSGRGDGSMPYNNPSWNNSSKMTAQSYSTSSGQADSNSQYRHDYPQVNKREQMWRQRWARAQDILGQKGVVLRSWKVGTDALEESTKLVQKANREVDEG
ncbi:hypothetical protein EJ05DRAFT_436608 [Pseudovirgaria hyperparasitica]|uniref:Phosphatidate phosphatase APP1 catalytic domain-containing protein n=1 Tax=Pseudovirgaria hyperparasitica TaxID=470096 RepID=A0A6A6WFG8_9PEZI|nr:uncharacterized protein EJ05DRAFT_436608 [Pseudovirgaria hyperparasitica]KAF2760636.1 hypothetical protein EJ05DRAFT_436608 [Pseudovirgaria hyperparasitica]